MFELSPAFMHWVKGKEREGKPVLFSKPNIHAEKFKLPIAERIMRDTDQQYVWLVPDLVGNAGVEAPNSPLM